MPLGTLERSPPPFFKQGPSALSRLVFYSALALFLMVADARFRITEPLRTLLAGLVYPAQWLALRPLQALQDAGAYLGSLSDTQSSEQALRRRLVLQAQRASQADQLALENERLRKLLELRSQLSSPAQAAQVLYDAADPYTRKVVIDKGLAHGVETGSPVIDEAGVLGQVTRVLPLVSEVTLVIDRDQTVPVLNTRTGVRSVVYGEPGLGVLELRFIAGSADVRPGDLLATSGVDGVYPPGLQVARVERVERRVDSAFARIHCTPLAMVDAAQHVMVMKPISTQIPRRPPPEGAAGAAAKDARK